MAAKPLPTLVENQENELELTPEQSKAEHRYHAQANVLSAELEQPLREKISPRAQVHLPPDGRYQYKQADPFRFEGIISYRSGYTQVAGHRSTRSGHGFTTLATSVVEHLNVLDVVTADRVVGQISTEHPLYPDGSVPAVTFLGTRFDNLRIGGHPVKLEHCPHIIGPRRDPNTSYFEDKSVLQRIKDQYTHLLDAVDRQSANGDVEKELSEWVNENYPKDRPLIQESGAATKSMQCSLVNSVDECPHLTFGHVIDVPHFGKVILAELKVNLEEAKTAQRPEDQEHDSYSFELTMIRLEMGCLAKGKAHIVMLDANGKGQGGGGKTNPPGPGN